MKHQKRLSSSSRIPLPSSLAPHDIPVPIAYTNPIADRLWTDYNRYRYVIFKPLNSHLPFLEYGFSSISLRCAMTRRVGILQFFRDRKERGISTPIPFIAHIKGHLQATTICICISRLTALRQPIIPDLKTPIPQACEKEHTLHGLPICNLKALTGMERNENSRSLLYGVKLGGCA
jgi:hypothetical protein